jgi:hypothetical protein
MAGDHGPRAWVGTRREQNLLEALVNDAEPTWLLVEEGVTPWRAAKPCRGRLRALERQGLVRSRRELAFDPSRSADSERRVVAVD